MSSTTNWGTATGTGRSTTTATAPAATAAPASSCPSAVDPRTATNTEPGVTARVSACRSVTAASPVRCTCWV